MKRNVLATLGLALVLAGCGTVNPTLPRKLVSSVVATQAIPTNWTVLRGTVQEILPEDLKGLTHQNFKIIAIDGQVFEVNHSTTHGKRIDALKVGAFVTIRGVVYRDKGRQGIHWTHHANELGDAGFIEFDGRRYE